MDVKLIEKNTDVEIEYHKIMNTFEIIIDAMKWIQYNHDNYDFDTIIAISENQLNKLRKFCINHVGDLESE